MWILSFSYFQAFADSVNLRFCASLQLWDISPCYLQGTGSLPPASVSSYLIPIADTLDWFSMSSLLLLSSVPLSMLSVVLSVFSS